MTGSLFPCCPAFNTIQEKNQNIPANSPRPQCLFSLSEVQLEVDSYLFLSGSLTAKIISLVYGHSRNKWNSPLPLFIFSVSAFIFRKEVLTGLQEQHSRNFCWSMGRPQGGKVSHACHSLFISWTSCHCTGACKKRGKVRARARAHLQVLTPGHPASLPAGTRWLHLQGS